MNTSGVVQRQLVYAFYALSGLGLDLGLRASGLGLIEIGLVARIFTVHMTLIDIHKIAIDNHLCCVLVAY